MNRYDLYPSYRGEYDEICEGQHRLSTYGPCAVVVSHMEDPSYGEAPEVWVSQQVVFVEKGVVVVHNWPDNGDRPGVVLYAEGARPYRSFQDQNVAFIPAPSGMKPEEYTDEEFIRYVETLLQWEL